LRRGGGSPSNTMWPGPRSTCKPSFILIHPTVWPQYTNVTDRHTYRTDDRQRSDSAQKGSPYAIGLLLCLSWMDQDAIWYGGRPRPSRLGTLCYMGTQLRHHKGHSSPQFSARIYCGQLAGWIKMPPGIETGLSAGDTVLDDTYR